MNTRGFVGFKLNGRITGYYHPYRSSYKELGLNVLEKYKLYSLDIIKDFFVNRVHFERNEQIDDYYLNNPEIMGMDWKTDQVSVMDDTDHLWNGKHNKFGYVYNLDDGTLELYRGLFLYPQREEDIKVKELLDSFGLGTPQYYTHQVCVAERRHIEVLEYYFAESDVREQKMINGWYPEQLFLGSTKLNVS